MTDCGCIDILCPHRGLDAAGGPYDVRSVTAPDPAVMDVRSVLRRSMDGMDTDELLRYVELCRVNGIGSGDVNAVLAEAIVQEHVACRCRFPVTFDRQAAAERMARHIGRCPSLRWRPLLRRRQRRAWLARAAQPA